MNRRWLIGLALIAALGILVACSGTDDPVDPGPVEDPGGQDPDPDDPPAETQVKLADHTVVKAFPAIPDSVFTAVDTGLRLYYGHTSHGRQLMTGLDMLAAEFPKCAEIPHVHEVNDDLGSLGDLSWVQLTRAWLEDNGHDYNVVLWSWCGGCSTNTPEGINDYLAAMAQLEADYPAHTFIYMTGHLDGTGVDGTLYASNNRIRDYCELNDKWLFDFADIESYDPDGNSYPDETDACTWCADWCETHDCGSCAECAHSHCFNCYRKGKAFWWLLARISGWESPATE